MAKPVNKRAIYLQIAKDLGLTVKEVEEAVENQFRFVAATMASNTYAQVRLPFFGRFWVKPQRLKHLQKFGLRLPEDEADTDD